MLTYQASTPVTQSQVKHKVCLMRWLMNWLAILADVLHGYLVMIVRVVFKATPTLVGEAFIFYL